VKVVKFKAIVHQEDGGYWAEVPSLPGCATEGDSLDELRAHLLEAIQGWLSVDFGERLLSRESWDVEFVR